jgi:hypothetical protein
MKRYTGDRTIDGIVVQVDDQPLPPRYDIKQFTDGDYEWAYEGLGPQQLALAILADHLGEAQTALRLSEPFMREIVAHFDNDWELTSADIDEAIKVLEANP